MANQEEIFYQKLTQTIDKLRKIERSGRRDIEPDFLAISNALDDYYLLSKLKVYCEYLSYSQIVRTDNISYRYEDFSLIRQMIDAVEDSRLDRPIFKIYNLIRELFSDLKDDVVRKNDVYLSLINLIEDNRVVIESEDLLHMYSFATNYCIRRINEGDERFYKLFIEANVLLLGIVASSPSRGAEQIPPSSVINVVGVALKIEDNSFFLNLNNYHSQEIDMERLVMDRFDWIEGFLTFHKRRENKKEPSVVYAYCTALLEHTRGNNGKAYRALYNSSRKSGVFLKMLIRILYLKILYELYQKSPLVLETDNVDIERVLESYRSLVRDEKDRRKRMSYQLSYYLDFEKLYKRLYRLSISYDGLGTRKDAKYSKLKKDLLQDISTSSHSYKKWLVEKVNEIN